MLSRYIVRRLRSADIDELFFSSLGVLVRKPTSKRENCEQEEENKKNKKKTKTMLMKSDIVNAISALIAIIRQCRQV